MNIDLKNKKPFFEGVCINDIIASNETPFYLYSQNEIINSIDKLKKNLKTEIFFSVKANSNQAILKLIKNCGLGADVVSAGELQRAIKAGFSSKKIIFEGVGKSKEDIEFAINKKIRLINIESFDELKKIDEIAKNNNIKINLGVRLNPDIDSQTIKKISTGKKTDKFGISFSELNEIIFLFKFSKNINLKGISCHIGSQIKSIDVFKKVFIKMKKAASFISSKNIDLKYIDLGGGFAVNYFKKENDFNIKNLGKLISSIFKKSTYKISFEPGRYIVAKSGILVTKILTSKINGGINFLITDAGMQTFIRPAMYDASHQPLPVIGPAHTLGQLYLSQPPGKAVKHSPSQLHTLYQEVEPNLQAGN